MNVRNLEALAFVALVCLSAPAMADGHNAEPDNRVDRTLIDGSESAAWLELQRSGVAASPYQQPLSGDVMEKVYKRYVDSFGAPIPARFPKETNSAGGGGQ